MKNRKFNLFLTGALLINLLQSYLTPITKDEAYYWRWSQHLDWGYFDHPPMVALLIKLSSFFFSDEMGVRFATVVLSILTAKIIWELIPVEKKLHKNSELLFFIILFSSPVFNIFSFITTPDTPLLLFSALYLLAIKKIDEKNNILNALFLGLSAALLLYSKYHGGIVILLSILFKPNLLKRKTTYIAGVFSLILVAPHIYWQYKNDFITFNYHLIQRRANDGFKIKNSIGYLLGAISILNPALVLILFNKWFKKRFLVNKNMVFLFLMFVGYLVFFLFYSFRGWVEAHWVAFAMIPLSVLIYNFCVLNQKSFKTIIYVGIISIVLISLGRVLIVLDLPIKTEFHTQHENYYVSIEKFAKGKKVLFVNSYQNASKYSFYTQKKSFSINTIDYRKNQYDLWNFEDEIKNNKVLLIGDKSSSFSDTLKLKSGAYITYKEINKFHLIGNLKANIKSPIRSIYKNQTAAIKLSINNPYYYDLNFSKESKGYQIAILLRKNKINTIVPLTLKTPQKLRAKTNNTIDAAFNLHSISEGKYTLSLVIKDKYLSYREISKKYTLEVRNVKQDVK